jgi:hypothetical protein
MACTDVQAVNVCITRSESPPPAMCMRYRQPDLQERSPWVAPQQPCSSPWCWVRLSCEIQLTRCAWCTSALERAQRSSTTCAQCGSAYSAVCSGASTEQARILLQYASTTDAMHGCNDAGTFATAHATGEKWPEDEPDEKKCSLKQPLRYQCATLPTA